MWPRQSQGSVVLHNVGWGVMGGGGRQDPHEPALCE